MLPLHAGPGLKDGGTREETLFVFWDEQTGGIVGFPPLGSIGFSLFAVRDYDGVKCVYKVTYELSICVEEVCFLESLLVLVLFPH